jgi:hypothetical protein
MFAASCDTRLRRRSTTIVEATCATQRCLHKMQVTPRRRKLRRRLVRGRAAAGLVSIDHFCQRGQHRIGSTSNSDE